MAKKEKIELTPEERLGLEEAKKAKRKIFGETFLKACALFLAVVFVYSVTYVAIGGGRTVYQTTPITSDMLGGAVSVGGGSGGGAQSSDNDANAPASNEAEEAAKAINEATKEAEKAGYTWKRSASMTNLNVGGATFTNILNGIIQIVDPKANVESVVGGFIGTGDKEKTIPKGADAAEEIGYHGGSYKLKATSLTAADLKGLKVEGDTYTFTLENVQTPKKDGSNALSRLTDDIVVQDEVSAEIQQQVGDKVSVTSLDGVYKNIQVKVVITDGKLVELTYSYAAEVTDLALRAGVTIHGTGNLTTTATYSDFVY